MTPDIREGEERWTLWVCDKPGCRNWAEQELGETCEVCEEGTICELSVAPKSALTTAEAQLAECKAERDDAIAVAEQRMCLCGRQAITASRDCERCMAIIATTHKAPNDPIRVLAEFIEWQDNQEGEPTPARRQAAHFVIREFLQQRQGHKRLLSPSEEKSE